MLKIGVSLSMDKTRFGPLLFSGDLPGGARAVRELGYTGFELSLRDPARIEYDWLAEILETSGLDAYTIATGLTA